MSLKPWKVLESKHLHRVFRMDTCELANGKLMDAFVLEFKQWVNILAITENNEAILIRQYRHGVQETVWEFPGGIVENGESPMEGANRELLEETDYASSNVIQVGKFYPNPAIQTNTMYCFLALDSKKMKEQDLDDGEDIEVHLIALDELIEKTKRGEFLHALQVATLFHAIAYMEEHRPGMPLSR